ncbi:tyrosine-type recombinase/integrase [Streptococcus gordonii]|uniref:tyrosine-type recombinase/integrase n=1 Tax=Streptococcus gordonii TaxID=1302 RepID=UPI0009BA4791|nr:tyrosine-type recombinase/integrase [Streptococcus gordonii]
MFSKISNNGVNKTLRNIVGRDVHAHSLRHTYASYLISKEVDLISISKVLGHENLTITLEVYAHQLEQQEEKIIIE